jgi:hypothetical protein
MCTRRVALSSGYSHPQTVSRSRRWVWICPAFSISVRSRGVLLEWQAHGSFVDADLVAVQMKFDAVDAQQPPPSHGDRLDGAGRGDRHPILRELVVR